MRKKAWVIGGCVLVPLILGLLHYTVPSRGRLIGCWHSTSGSQELHLWEDGTFRMSQFGFEVFEGVWRLRGFRLEVELVVRSSTLGGTPKPIASYEFRAFPVTMAGSDKIRMGGSTMVRGQDDAVDKPVRRADWPDAPRAPLPLFLAIEKGDERTVSRLLQENRGWVTNLNHDGGSGIVWAASYGHPKIVKLLMESGANPNTVNHHGLSLPSIAILGLGTERNIDAIVELLLAQRVAVDQASENGTTPLIAAVSKGMAATAERLLRAGANPNASLTDGSTALHVAVYEGHARMAALLLRNGADMNRTNKAGKSARALSMEQGGPELKALFTSEVMPR